MDRQQEANNSMTLRVKFDQYKDVEPVIATYNILETKTERKTRYVVNALDHCEKNAYKCSQKRDFNFFNNCMKFIKSYYNLDSKASVATLLDAEEDSASYITCKTRKTQNKEPRVKQLFFSRKSEHELETHEKLNDMIPKKRIMMISESVVDYVKDEKDNASLISEAFRMLYDTIDKYRSSQTKEEKEMIVNNFYQVLSKCEI